MEPTKRVTDLVVITDRLAEVLERENALLREHKHNELGAILDEKVTLGRVYESRLLGLAEVEDPMNGVDEDLRQRLVEAGSRVNDLIGENAMLLEVAIAANKRVVDMVADAVKDLGGNNAGVYDHHGSTDLPAHGAKSANLSLSLNQTL